jgi:RNA polymerase sigma-70 factor (ECF subfamily)
MVVSANSDPEQALIHAIRDGDHPAFEELVRRNSRWVRGVIFGVLGNRDRIDDVAQQVWLTVWSRIRELRSPERWRPWLYRLARNAALDVGRAVSRDRSVAQPTPDYAEPAASPPPEQLIGEERKALMLDAIRALPAHYREPFVLRHLEGWGYREIGESLELPVDTVETRLVRARRMLRETLKDKV